MFDPNDHYYNLTSLEFWRNTYRGQAMDGKSLADLKPSGGRGVIIRSPYPYKSAQEHFDAWKKAAGGGVKKDRNSLPDWSGDWQGVASGVLFDGAKVSDVMAAVSDEYKPRYEQILRNEGAGKPWWPTEFCLPGGFGRIYGESGPNWHFMADQTMVLINKDRHNSETRYIYTDGRGFLPAEYQFPQWYGESQGFWDGDELVVYTAHIVPWVIAHAEPEYSDQLEAIERIKRVGQNILLDITMYDPKAFAFPWHDTVVFNKVDDWKTSPSTFNECVYTNNAYMDSNGEMREHTPGDPDYRDFSDPRPWATAYDRMDAAAAKNGK